MNQLVRETSGMPRPISSLVLTASLAILACSTSRAANRLVLQTNPASTPTSVTGFVPSPTLDAAARTPRAPLCPDWNGYSLANRRCTSDECLFIAEYEMCADHPIGLATLHGYYLQREREDWGSELVTCDSFVVFSGSDVLIDSILRLIAKGNAVHDLSESGRPIVNLNLRNLEQDAKDRLTASSSESQVELVLLALSPTHAGVSVCFSPFEIIDVR